MSAQIDIAPTPTDEKPDRALLDAIARIHPLALLVDAEGCVVWLSDAFAELCPEGGDVIWRGDAESDFKAVEDGYVSVTPLHLDLTNYKLLEEIRAWNLGL